MLDVFLSTLFSSTDFTIPNKEDIVRPTTEHLQVDVYAFGIVIWELVTGGSWHRTLTQLLREKNKSTEDMNLRDLIMQTPDTGTRSDEVLVGVCRCICARVCV